MVRLAIVVAQQIMAHATATIDHVMVHVRYDVIARNWWTGETEFSRGKVHIVCVAFVGTLRVGSWRLHTASNTSQVVHIVFVAMLGTVQVPNTFLFSPAWFTPVALLVEAIPGPALLQRTSFVTALVSLLFLLLLIYRVIVPRSPARVQLHV
jgi:hypothetical protein